jgi:hypothetical protein
MGHQPHSADRDWRGAVEALRTEPTTGAWHRAVVACGGLLASWSTRPALDLELLARADDSAVAKLPSLAPSSCRLVWPGLRGINPGRSRLHVEAEFIRPWSALGASPSSEEPGMAITARLPAALRIRS